MYNKIIKEVAAELGIPISLANNVYRAYWKSVKRHIADLPLKQDLTEAQYNELKVNVNIPSLGKFVCPWPQYQKIVNKYKDYVESKENQTSIHKNTDNSKQI